MSPAVQLQIANLWWEHSQPASELYGKTLTPEQLDIEVLRVMKAPPYTIAGQICSAGCCKSPNTALKYKPAFVIKPHRKTDYCRYCRRLRILISRGRAHLTKLRERYGWEDNLVIIDLMTYWLRMEPEQKQAMTDADTVQVEEYLAELAEMQYHKDSCEEQRRFFSSQVQEARAADSKLSVIVIDYKGNLELGHGPVEQDERYHNMRSCTCVMTVTYLPGVVIHCDFVSTVLTHDSEVSCFVTSRLIDMLATNPLTRSKWKDQIETISIWSDCGPHFRSEVYSNFCLHDLPLQEKKAVQKHCFGEKHGKGPCDDHGQKVECYTDEYTEHVKEILSPEDVKTALLSVNKRVNEVRVARKLLPHNLWVEVYTKEDVLLKREHTPARRMALKGTSPKFGFQLRVRLEVLLPV